MRLSELPIGHRGRIRTIDVSELHASVTRRLQEMGFIPGAEVDIVRAAPWGDPLVYRVRGTLIGLRLSEAQLIEMDVLKVEGEK